MVSTSPAARVAAWPGGWGEPAHRADRLALGPDRRRAGRPGDGRGFRHLARPRAAAPQVVHPGAVLAAGRDLFRDQAMPLLYAEAFLLMGVVVTIYNYVGFRLVAPPFTLGHAAVGAIFLLYLPGRGARPGSGIWPRGADGS